MPSGGLSGSALSEEGSTARRTEWHLILSPNAAAKRDRLHARPPPLRDSQRAISGARTTTRGQRRETFSRPPQKKAVPAHPSSKWRAVGPSRPGSSKLVLARVAPAVGS